MQVPNSMLAPDVAAFIAAQIAAAQPTGVVEDYFGLTAPAGYVLADGRTIGSASSGATNRANADTQALFVLLWNSLADVQAPVSGGRGASAAADWAANKTITLPDLRGRIIAGRDNMGGTAAGRLTSAGSGLDGTVMGNAGGAETVTLTAAQIPAHNHPLAAPFNTTTAGGAATFTAAANVSATGSSTTLNTANNTGGGGAHNNTQPTIVANKIIKL